jgi:hypothetical protein
MVDSSILVSQTVRFLWFEQSAITLFRWILSVTARIRLLAIYSSCPAVSEVSWHFGKALWKAFLTFLSHPFCSPHSPCLEIAFLWVWDHATALHQEFELCGTSESSSKRHWHITLGSCRFKIVWRRWNRGALQEDCGGDPVCLVRGSCTHLTGMVKSNSSGIEVWRGSLIQAGSRSREILIE